MSSNVDGVTENLLLADSRTAEDEPEQQVAFPIKNRVWHLGGQGETKRPEEGYGAIGFESVPVDL